MGAVASQITSLTIVYSTAYLGKENIKAPRHWPLWGEFTGDQRIPRTKGQLRGKCSHLMTSSWVLRTITATSCSWLVSCDALGVCSGDRMKPLFTSISTFYCEAHFNNNFHLQFKFHWKFSLLQLNFWQSGRHKCYICHNFAAPVPREKLLSDYYIILCMRAKRNPSGPFYYHGLF